MQEQNFQPWQGIVKAIHHGSIRTEVTLEVAPNISITALVSRIYLEELGLTIGAKAYAKIRSKEIILAIDQM